MKKRNIFQNRSQQLLRLFEKVGNRLKMKTEVKNRVNTLVDRLFPSFLNEKNTGINPFSKSSLVPMEDRFSAQQIRRRQLNRLAKV